MDHPQWESSIADMRQLFGEESPEYKEFIRLSIKELQGFPVYYRHAHELTDNRKMRRIRHRLRPTMKLFGGEYWCDRLKHADYTGCEEDLDQMKDWLDGLVSYLKEEQQNVTN